MALPRNRLIPVLALAGLAIVAVILLKQFGSSGRVQPGKTMDTPPVAAAASSASKSGKSADADTPQETLATVAQRLNAVLDDNNKLREEINAMRDATSARDLASRPSTTPTGKPTAGAQAGASAASSPLLDLPPSAGETAHASGGTAGVVDRAGHMLGSSVDNLASTIDALRGQPGDPKVAPGAGRQPSAAGVPAGLGFNGTGAGVPGTGEPRGPTYRVVAPLGWAAEAKGQEAAKPLVRTALGPGTVPAAGRQPSPADLGGQQLPGDPGQAGRSGPAGRTGDEDATPYFTIPENATLTRVTAMTALIGRVPIDGKVTDPMQFKAIIGRENLAANGLDVPDDVSGIVVSGIAVGDMALSCNEGKIHSLTFVFNDGTIRTISQRDKRGSASGPTERAIGYISDLRGNPCVAGQFVTNAPAYLTDVVGMRALGVAAASYAAAQTSTSENGVTGATTTAVTGSRGAYVLGQAAAGATDQVSQWLLQRLKNSFDAVVTPAGQKIVVHIDQELAIDRPKAGRKLDHHRSSRTAQVATSAGEHHGLD